MCEKKRADSGDATRAAAFSSYERATLESPKKLSPLALLQLGLLTVRQQQADVRVVEATAVDEARRGERRANATSA